MEGTNRKKCFIITPIGNEGTDIRRHIDGIIDAAIKPVVEDEFKYELEVSHRIDEPGNIPKQVITSVFDSQLVIANLTGNNPNVMYELALRHCFGSVVIIIAEEGTSIPADIVGERTIFYINDAQGVIDLKDRLKKMISNIESNEVIQQHGPVYDALRDRLNTDNVIQSINTDSVDTFMLLLNKIDGLEKSINLKDNSINSARHIKKQSVDFIVNVKGLDKQKLIRVISDEIIPNVNKMGIPFTYTVPENGVFRVRFNVLRAQDYSMLTSVIKDVLLKNGGKDIKFGFEIV